MAKYSGDEATKLVEKHVAGGSLTITIRRLVDDGESTCDYSYFAIVII